MPASGPVFRKRIAGPEEEQLGTDAHILGTAGSIIQFCFIFKYVNKWGVFLHELFAFFCIIGHSVPA